MGIYDGTEAAVKGCRWWDRRDMRLCPLYNDCCDICMHPDAPRDDELRRMTCGYEDVHGGPPEGCPLRKGPLELHLKTEEDDDGKD
jgi:hypothetical protein